MIARRPPKRQKSPLRLSFCPFLAWRAATGGRALLHQHLRPRQLGSSRAAGSQVGATCPLRLTARRASLGNSLPIEAHHISCVNKARGHTAGTTAGASEEPSIAARPRPFSGPRTDTGPCWPTTRIISDPLPPAALSRRARPQHQFCGSQLRSKILVFQCLEYDALGTVEGLFEFFG